MSIVIGLCSLILIYLEFFVPGGILGALGAIAFLTSICLFVWTSGGMLFSVLWIVALVFFLVLTMRLALWKIKRKPEMFAQEEQTGYVAASFDRSLVGKKGEAATNLRPSGHVVIEGNYHQAVSESAYIKKGELVKIIDGRGAYLICKKVEEV